MARPFMKNKVDSGEKLYIWHDHWHPNVALLLKYQSMMLLVLPKLKFQFFCIMVAGIGLLLDLRTWLRFKVACFK